MIFYITKELSRRSASQKWTDSGSSLQKDDYFNHKGVKLKSSITKVDTSTITIACL